MISEITNIRAYKLSSDFDVFTTLLDNNLEIVCYIKLDNKLDTIKHLAVAYRNKKKHYIIYSADLALKVHNFDNKDSLKKEFEELNIEFILPSREF